MEESKVLVFDTETSGFPRKGYDYRDEKQSWVIQLGWMLCGSEKVYQQGGFILKNEYKSNMNPFAFDAHHITVDTSNDIGLSDLTVLAIFTECANMADLIVCHNYAFDIQMIEILYGEASFTAQYQNFAAKPHYCTMKESTDTMKLPKKRGSGYKWPKLEELYPFLFNGETFDGAHDAFADVMATKRSYYELIRRENQAIEDLKTDQV
jgi:DNA polymerase III epsilon subunit-like protein